VPSADTEYTYNAGSSVQALAIWETLSFGNSANMASKATWTCPAAGLWHIAATFGFSMNTNDQSCSFQLFHNGVEVWYFTAWYNIASAGQGITTQCESIFLNLAAGDTLEWYVQFVSSSTMTIGGGNNSGNTTFNAIRLAPGYTVIYCSIRDFLDGYIIDGLQSPKCDFCKALLGPSPGPAST